MSDFVERVALLWQKILRVDHANTFAGASGALIDRPHGHDRLPQPGYVGVRYRQGGILLLGQNPGNDPIGKGQSPEDLHQYLILNRLKDSPNAAAATTAARELMVALGTNVMPSWPIIRNVVRPLLAALGLDLDDVAYTNLVKFRTMDSGIKASIYDAWPVTLEQISLLNPSNIIVLGVEANKQFMRRYKGNADLYHIPRAIGDTRLSAEGAAAIDQIVEHLRRVH